MNTEQVKEVVKKLPLVANNSAAAALLQNGEWGVFQKESNDSCWVVVKTSNGVAFVISIDTPVV